MYEEEEALRDEVKGEEGCTQARFSEQNNRKPTGQINDMSNEILLHTRNPEELLRGISRRGEKVKCVSTTVEFKNTDESKTVV